MTTIWSSEQAAIFDAIINANDNLMVIARAGCGKSTTIREAAKIALEKRGGLVGIVQFGNAISKENALKCVPGIASVTLHSHGARALGKYKRFFVVENKTRNIAEKLIPDDDCDKNSWLSAIEAAVSKCKNWAVDINNTSEIKDVIHRYDIEAPNEENSKLAIYTQQVLRESIIEYKNHGIINLDDMLWLPVMLNLKRFNKFDYLFVDESQDLNMIQFLIVERSLTSKGRVIFVGDNRQAIFGWRGAMPNSMQLCAERFKTREFKLTVTYRCAKSIVALANREVPDLKAHESANEGSISNISAEAGKLFEMAKPGDFILSRRNAPLVSTCLKLIALGKPAKVAGKDLIKGLKALINGSRKKTVSEFLDFVDEWESNEIDRLLRQKKEDLIEAVKDKAEVFRVLAEGKKKTSEMIDRIDEIFDENHSEKIIVVSSVHRAKGLERERVFMLADTFQSNSKYVEERNLWYVAVTRAKNELFIVS